MRPDRYMRNRTRQAALGILLLPLMALQFSSLGAFVIHRHGRHVAHFHALSAADLEAHAESSADFGHRSRHHADSVETAEVVLFGLVLPAAGSATFEAESTRPATDENRAASVTLQAAVDAEETRTCCGVADEAACVCGIGGVAWIPVRITLHSLLL